MIVWRDKLLAFGVHFLATALLAALAAALIFLVWYPHPYERMVHGLELFRLVILCDLALGPLLSFVVFDRTKTRRALAVDYTVIAIVQIAGLCYGVYTVAEARPVYVAFTVDRYEVVSELDMRPEEVAAAADPRYRHAPLSGPRYVAVRTPENERQQSLTDELAGNPPFARPRWYVEVSSALPDILAHSQTLDQFEQAHPRAKPLLAAELARIGVPRDRLRLIPVSTRRAFWTAIIDVKDGLPVGWLDFDPY